MLVAGVLAQDDGDSRALLFTALVVVVVGGGVLAFGLYPRLVVSDQGLVLRQVGWQVSTTAGRR